jgi:hypothetical protein
MKANTDTWGMISNNTNNETSWCLNVRLHGCEIKVSSVVLLAWQLLICNVLCISGAINRITIDPEGAV